MEREKKIMEKEKNKTKQNKTKQNPWPYNKKCYLLTFLVFLFPVFLFPVFLFPVFITNNTYNCPICLFERFARVVSLISALVPWSNILFGDNRVCSKL